MLKAFAVGAALAGALVTLSAAGAQAQALKGSDLLIHARIPPEKARAIALHVHPGAVTDQELAKAGAVYKYSFAIRDTSGAVYTVAVDAKSGQVLQNAKAG
jgi:uncharacterized membrane protein YkoI